MPGRMESVENLVAAAVPGSRNRGWFSTLPTAPWKSLRDSHSSTAPTMTILSYHQGDTSTGLPKGTFLLGLDTCHDTPLLCPGPCARLRQKRPKSGSRSSKHVYLRNGGGL